MIDIHCHLNFHGFEDTYDAAIQRAKDKGVHTIVNVGTRLDSSEWAVKLAEEYENLYAIVGVHPHHADKVIEESAHSRHSRPDRESVTDSRLRGNDNSDWIEQLEKIANHPKVIGIGECGMDYYSYQSNGVVDKKLQRDVFEKQIGLAYRLKLPLQIHHRQVGQELLDVLEYHKSSLLPIPGMFHCFAGSMDFLKSALAMGFFIGFDGNLTYKGIAKGETTDLKDIARFVPIERIVTETDSPFLTPEPFRGTRNEPMYVYRVCEVLAELKDVPLNTLIEVTEKNVYTVFTKLKPTYD